MKVISRGEAFDFNNAERLYYRESVVGDGYPIGYHRVNARLLENAVEFARVETEELAQALVQAVTEKWAENVPVFDVDAWLQEKRVDLAEKERVRKENTPKHDLEYADGNGVFHFFGAFGKPTIMPEDEYDKKRDRAFSFLKFGFVILAMAALLFGASKLPGLFPGFGEILASVIMALRPFLTFFNVLAVGSLPFILYGGGWLVCSAAKHKRLMNKKRYSALYRPEDVYFIKMEIGNQGVRIERSHHIPSKLRHCVQGCVGSDNAKWVVEDPQAAKPTRVYEYNRKDVRTLDFPEGGPLVVRGAATITYDVGGKYEYTSPVELHRKNEDYIWVPERMREDVSMVIRAFLNEKSLEGG